MPPICPRAVDPCSLTDPSHPVCLGHFARLRLSAGFPSQQSLADHISVDRSTVRRWESGERSPPPGIALYLRHLANDLAHKQRSPSP